MGTRRKSAPRKSVSPRIYEEPEVYVKPTIKGKIRIKLKLDPPVKTKLKSPAKRGAYKKSASRSTHGPR